MTSISLPPQSHSLPNPALHEHSRRNLSMSTPLPNPPFVFPARDPDSRSSPSPRFSAPSVARSPPPALPAFSFNPGSASGSGSDNAPQPSPPLAPPVNRPSGHRRRPSEFVGGDKLVSPPTSEVTQPGPTMDQKPDENPMHSSDKLPAPGPGFSAGGPVKRRHAHRRSAAVSSVDLTAISNALDTKPTLGSAPCAPADRKPDAPTFDEIPRPMSHSATSLTQRSPPASPQFQAPGTSSHPQLIVPNGPGPSEEEQHPPSADPMKTSEDVQTAQPTQDVRSSGPPAIKISPSNDEKPRVRPKTADASWLFEQSGGSGSHHKRSLSATGHSRTHKSLSSGLLDAAQRKKDHSGDEAQLTDSSRYSCSDDDSDTSVEHQESGTSKKKAKSKARKKKVRSWAGSILTRGKGKRDHPRKDISSEANSPKTPPMITRTNSDLGSGLDVDFDDDNIVVVRTPTNTSVPVPTTVNAPVQPSPAPPAPQPSLESSWKPRSFYEQGLPDDMSSAVIDLDAALGPFNTPDMGPGKPASSGFSVATRRMYSGGRRGEFVGPEMRFHRRTESAPEMPPFDRTQLNSNRLTQNPSLENPDVFDEEEEDAFLAATSEPSHEDERRVSQVGSVIVDHPDEHTSSKDSSDTVKGRPVDVEATDSEHASGLGIRRNASSSEFSETGAPCSEPERKYSDHQNFAEQMRNARNPFVNPPRSPVEVIRQEDWQRNRPPVPPSPDVSPRFMPADKRPATSPIELGSNIPAFSLQGGSSQSNSAFPSPDFTGSSSDTRRSVATPTTIDRHFFHPSYHNMSADFPHASVEDVPSLTSSASTSTNPLQRFSASFFPRRGSSDRAASFSVGVNRRTSASHAAKRSSLASLSKLVAGHHANERSKLSYEEKPPGDAPEKAKKKGRRIGRFMHFWRTKDKDKNGDTAPEERHT